MVNNKISYQKFYRERLQGFQPGIEEGDIEREIFEREMAFKDMDKEWKGTSIYI